MKIKLTLAIFLLIVISVKAQIYTPSGIIQGASTSNNIGIGATSPLGKLDIFTGLTGTTSLATLPTGTISFGNNNTTLTIPTIFSKSSNSVGMSLFTGTNETNASPDMRFVVMEQTGKDYLPSNLTSTAFRFSRFNQTLVDFLRNGNVGIGTSSPIGKLNILTGTSGLTYDVVSQPIGSISFANGSASNPVPIMVGKGNNNAGLYFLSATTNGNTNADILFDVRNNTDNDFTDLTKTACRFRRYGIPLVDILRNGNVGIGTTSPFGKLDVVGSKTATYTSSLNSPTYDFLRIANIHGEGGSDQYSALTLSVTGNTGANNAFVNLAVIQPVAGNSNSEFALTVRQASGVMNEVLRAKSDGKIGIGTSNPTSKLTVAGDIHSREVRVSVDAGADFVFENNYNLPSLYSVDRYIKENKHLPEIASADEMKKEGINLSAMNIKLLQKIEELTLYTIEQQKNTENLTKIIEALTKRLEVVEKK